MTRERSNSFRVRPWWAVVVLVLGATLIHASEIRVATGPWPDSIPRVPTSAANSPGPFFTAVDLTVVEDTLTVENKGRTVSIIGEARNDQAGSVWLLPLVLAGMDADGELVDSATSSMQGMAAVTSRDLPFEWLGPGETGWFEASLETSDDRPVETVLVRAQGMIQSPKTTTTAPHGGDTGLEMVGDWQVERDGWSLTLTGVVRNTGPEDLVGLRVATAFRDPTGSMIEVGVNTPRAERIGGFLGGVRSGREVEVELWYYMDPDAFDASTMETRLNAFTIGDPRHRYAIIGIAHQGGIGGSNWQSSIGLVNQSGAAAEVLLTYKYGSGKSHSWISLEDGEAFHRDEVAVELFDVDGPSAGYVLVSSNAPLKISGRTSNETPLGGFGQALPVVTPGMTYNFESNEGLTGVLSNLRGGPDFRTNIGLVNLGDERCSARVHVLDTAGNTVTDWGRIELERTEWRQVNRAVPHAVEAAYATVEPEPGCPIWAYASVIAEATGDPVTVTLERWVEIDLHPPSFGFRFVIPWADHDDDPLPP